MFGTNQGTSLLTALQPWWTITYPAKSQRRRALDENVVNALWAGGAEAMMLQDQRVISTSAVRCVGNTLILQGRVYSPPYVIQAIGDQAGMLAALEGSKKVKDYRDYANFFGLAYDVTSKTQTNFPAYKGSLSLLYAKTE